jgi:hypothetical protein
MPAEAQGGINATQTERPFTPPLARREKNVISGHSPPIWGKERASVPLGCIAGAGNGFRFAESGRWR